MEITKRTEEIKPWCGGAWILNKLIFEGHAKKYQSVYPITTYYLI